MSGPALPTKPAAIVPERPPAVDQHAFEGLLLAGAKEVSQSIDMNWLRGQIAKGFSAALDRITSAHGSPDGITLRGFFYVEAEELRMSWPAPPGSPPEQQACHMAFSIPQGKVIWDGIGHFSIQVLELPGSEVKKHLEGLAKSTFGEGFSSNFTSAQLVAYGALIFMRLAAQDAGLIPVEGLANGVVNLATVPEIIRSSNLTAFQVASIEKIPTGLYRLQVEKALPF